MVTDSHESLLYGNESSPMEVTYRKLAHLNTFDLKISDSSFSFPKTSVEFDPNARSVTLNDSKKAALNSDNPLVGNLSAKVSIIYDFDIITPSMWRRFL
jgi:hypothetical protein